MTEKGNNADEQSSSVLYVQEQDEDSPLSDTLQELPSYITRGIIYLLLLLLAYSLTWRISLSLVLFALLILGYYLGWITPHPIRPVPY